MSHRLGSFDVVTGGGGFIGSHICRALVQRGRRVRIVDNFSTGRESNLADLQEASSIEVVRQDLRDLGGLEGLFAEAETVYHQGAIPSVQRSVDDPLESNQANVEGTLHVLVAARNQGVRKLIFAASSSAYGDSEVLPKREDMAPNPLSPYAVTKYVGELYCKVFSEIYQLPTVALRYFNVFGPYQDPGSEYAAVIPRFITRMLQGRRPVIFGDGEQSRDFTYVENVVTANLLAAQSPVQGICLNIACGERYTLNHLVELLNEILQTRLGPIYEDPRPGDVRHSEADIALAAEKIGYRPAISFREGLEKTVQWFARARPDGGRERPGEGISPAAGAHSWSEDG